jgi:uncharacterized tellurite resistance protein B-like protein
MERRTPDFARILAPASHKGDGGFAALRGNEVDAVIELGFMMVNANGDASIDELESFRALVKYLKPAADVAKLLDHYGDQLERAESFEQRVRAAAEHLTRQSARELAYKAVYAVAVFDLETNEHERELEDLVVEVLGLDENRAHELALEATQALSS